MFLRNTITIIKYILKVDYLYLMQLLMQFRTLYECKKMEPE